MARDGRSGVSLLFKKKYYGEDFYTWTRPPHRGDKRKRRSFRDLMMRLPLDIRTRVEAAGARTLADVRDGKCLLRSPLLNRADLNEIADALRAYYRPHGSLLD